VQNTNGKEESSEEGKEDKEEEIILPEFFGNPAARKWRGLFFVVI
jgi:hypothetical protein